MSNENTAPQADATPEVNGKPKTDRSNRQIKGGQKGGWPTDAKGKGAKAKPAKAGKGSPLSFVKVGAAELKSVPLKALTFDRRLQHRSKIQDETTVESYAETDAENAKAGKPSVFPPLLAVHQSVDESGKPCDLYWVYDGFQRGGAFAKNGRKTVQVQCVEGTFDDAFLLSLSSNSTNSELPRNRDDKRRSVLALIDAEATLALVMKKSAAFGGGMRAIAAACGVSVGTVDNALADVGLKVSGDKLVKRPAEKAKADKPKPAAASEVAPVKAAPKGEDGTVDPTATELNDASKKKANEEAFKLIQQAAFADRVAECAKITRRLSVILSTLVTDKTCREEVRKVMAAHGVSVSDEFDVRAKSEGKNFQPYYEILELWPVSSKLGAVFADMKKIDLTAGEPKEGEKGKDAK